MTNPLVAWSESSSPGDTGDLLPGGKPEEPPVDFEEVAVREIVVVASYGVLCGNICTVVATVTAACAIETLRPEAVQSVKNHTKTRQNSIWISSSSARRLSGCIWIGRC